VREEGHKLDEAACVSVCVFKSNGAPKGRMIRQTNLTKQGDPVTFTERVLSTRGLEESGNPLPEIVTEVPPDKNRM